MQFEEASQPYGRGGFKLRPEVTRKVFEAAITSAKFRWWWKTSPSQSELYYTPVKWPSTEKSASFILEMIYCTSRIASSILAVPIKPYECLFWPPWNDQSTLKWDWCPSKGSWILFAAQAQLRIVEVLACKRTVKDPEPWHVQVLAIFLNICLATFFAMAFSFKSPSIMSGLPLLQCSVSNRRQFLQ